MTADKSFSRFQGGFSSNSLCDILQLNEANENDIQPIIHSPYYDMDTLKLLTEQNNGCFSILSSNVESINAKMNEIEAFVEELSQMHFKFSLMCFQECWLSDNDDKSHLQIDGYDCITQGKTCGNKGGLVMYINNCFNYKVIMTLNQFDHWEGQFVKITGGGLSKDVIIGNIYRPPRDLNENYIQFLNEFTSIISLIDKTNSDIIIAGDFNINLLKINEKKIVGEFFDMLISNSFYPHITLPTRFSNNSGTLIDNLFCRIDKYAKQPKSGILTKQFSDHQPCFTFLNNVQLKDKPPKYITIRIQSEQAISNFLHDIISSDVYNNLNQSPTADPNVNYNMLHDVIKLAKDKHMPYKTVKFNKYKHKKSTWITLAILKSIRYRDKLRNKLKLMHADSHEYNMTRANLMAYNAVLKKCIRAAKQMHYESCFNKFKHNIRKTWDTINNILSRSNKSKNFPSSYIHNDKVMTDKTDIANAFNDYFTNTVKTSMTALNTPSNKTFKHYMNDEHTHLFCFETIDDEIISKTIDSIQPKTSCGFDGISSQLLKSLKPALTQPLRLITNQILTTGIFPDKLKIAKVVYVNDFALSSEKFKFVMYADDTTLTSTLETFSTNELNGNPASSINIELNKISEWLKLNRLTLNVQKTKYMLFKTSKKKVQTLLLQMDNKIIDKVLDFNFLGIHFNEQLNWKSHIDKLSVKCCRILGILNRLKRILPLNIKIILYNSLMLPHLNYGITLWGFKCERILKLQKKAARILSASKYNAHTEPLFKNLKLLKIEHILKLHELKLYYKFIHIRLPVYLQNLKLDQNSSIHNINTRGQHNIHTTRVQHEFAKHSLRYTLPRTINNTPNIIINKIYTHSLHGFATYIKNFFIQTYNIVPCTIINCYICQ